MRKLVIILTYFTFLFNAKSAKKELTQEQFLWYVKNYHPISQQAAILVQQGKQGVRKARGGFDPYLYGDLNQKAYKDKEYYHLVNAGLKIPTWYGIELKTGFEQNRGVFLNPENNLPVGGLWSAGAKIKLGKGLFIDERRATLRQAQIMQEASLAEQKKIINDLFYEAIQKYWQWTEAWNEYLIYEEAVELALQRQQGVVQSYIFGDKPAIDTLEAYIQYQNRQIKRNEMWLNYQNTTLELSNYLWFENNTPLEIDVDSISPPILNNVQPEPYVTEDTVATLIANIETAHPDLQLYQYKLNILQIQKRLKIEKLKPEININYNALTEPVRSDWLSQINSQNYKWGLEVAFPLFLREQRGDLKLNQLKTSYTEFSQEQKILELTNKVKSFYNKQSVLRNQVGLYSSAVGNYQILLQAETRKFDIGESSLFLINSRENKLIQARLKLVELNAKYFQSYSGIYWAAGTLYLY